MTRFDDKPKLLKILAETPVVSYACNKIGLDKSTYYRWYKDDKNFRDRAERVLTIGRKNINDMAESSIIKEINSGNMRANIFWLQHNDPRYRPVRTSYVAPQEHHHNLKPGEVCQTCGYKEPEPSKREKERSLNNKELSDEIYKRLQLHKRRNISPEEIRNALEEIITDNKPETQFNIKWIVQNPDEDEEGS
jgi:hypothetical protein